MNFAAAVLAIVVLGATPALSAGFEQVMVPDPSGAPLEVGIWYPSEAPATSQPLGPFEQTVAIGGAVAGRGLPLVVMSHGTGGSFTGHYDTALALVEAGFVVAAVTHTGDNYRERTLVGRLENRPRHIKILIDYMLASWRQHDTIDPSRIGMFGFSAGGFTALVAIGGTPDMSTVAPYCAAHPDEWTCRMIKDRNISVSADTTGQSTDSAGLGPRSPHRRRRDRVAGARLRVLGQVTFRRDGADPALAWRQRRNPAASQLRPSRL